MSNETPAEQAEILLANTVDALPKGLLQNQLVEAAKETNAALERDGDPAFAHLILDNKAALAPFTKGQNDE